MRLLAAILALLGGAGVAAGAYGAHGAGLDPAAQALWETAVLYLLVHAGVGLLAALQAHRLGSLGLAAAGCFAVGSVLFSGSLFLLALAGASVGPTAPAGGIMLIAGWVILAAAAVTMRRGPGSGRS